MLTNFKGIIYGLEAYSSSKVVFLGGKIHMMWVYHQICYDKLVLCYFGDCLGHEYPWDKFFSAHFDCFCVQLVWIKVAVCIIVGSDIRKNEAKYCAKFCVSKTLDKYRLGVRN